MLPFFVLAAALTVGSHVDLPCYGRVKVIDSVDCTKTDHDFLEIPAGKSRVETVLGRACRVMNVQDGETSSMFKYRLGKGAGLKANGSYVIVLDYPDDKPRTYILHNRATNSRRSFATGRSTGDCVRPQYVDNHDESYDLPQSCKWERWICYTSLTDRTPDYKETKDVILTPADGFDFVVSQYAREHDFVSDGIAVSSISLCEIPDEAACAVKLALPPAPLPHRRIFWREEMSDGGPLQGGKDKRHCLDQVDWYRHKCRQMKMLGMNCFMRDLLEFGHVQHWNPDAIRPGWAWASDAECNSLWERSLDMLAKEYPEFDVLPYYEWAGNFGADYNGQKAYGYRPNCETLNGNPHYTHITWSENNLDVTDPEALEVTKQLMDGTILMFKDKVTFAGALFRTRPTQWPIGFGDATRRRFADEANGGKAVSKDDLRRDKALYEKYVAWWHGRRAAFLGAIRAYLVEKGLKDPLVLLDADPTETGPGVKGGGFVTDDKEAWRERFVASGHHVPNLFTRAEALADHRYLADRESSAGTWDNWEWQHAVPGDRPSLFAKADNCALVMPVNRLYSVDDPTAFAAYADAKGRTTMVRHHSLNENMQVAKVDGKDEKIVGYAIADVERAGRASMMVEIEAMAKGDPVNLGYFIGSCFARGFPGPVREFNENYLALPALPSRVVPNACSDPEVTLREIDCTKIGKGRYYALVHTGKTAKKDIAVKIPGTARAVTLPAFGKVRPLKNGRLELKALRPWQLLTLHVK